MLLLHPTNFPSPIRGRRFLPQHPSCFLGEIDPCFPCLIFAAGQDVLCPFRPDAPLPLHPDLRRRQPPVAAERAAEITQVVVARSHRDLGDRLLRIAEQILGFVDADPVDVVGDGAPRQLAEQPAEVEPAERSEPRQRIHRQLLRVMRLDMMEDRPEPLQVAQPRARLRLGQPDLDIAPQQQRQQPVQQRFHRQLEARLAPGELALQLLHAGVQLPVSANDVAEQDAVLNDRRDVFGFGRVWRQALQQAQIGDKAVVFDLVRQQDAHMDIVAVHRDQIAGSGFVGSVVAFHDCMPRTDVEKLHMIVPMSLEQNPAASRKARGAQLDREVRVGHAHFLQ
ncbi:hypothetical protein BN871_BF_00490 [Paenibacillus sp. P22]|nr:hypothetical protein BN871_BF_00490 [Paenibacillus sp. P22]